MPLSNAYCETVERLEERIGSPPTGDDETYRQLLRAFLASQVGFERARSLRQTLLFALTPTSAVLWVLAAWPGSLPVSVRSMSLRVWSLLFTALLCTWFVELLWLRRSADARRHLRAMAPQPGERFRATE